jgi:hypothetical protein
MCHQKDIRTNFQLFYRINYNMVLISYTQRKHNITMSVIKLEKLRHVLIPRKRFIRT